MLIIPRACLLLSLFLLVALGSTKAEMLHFDGAFANECSIFNVTLCNFNDAKYWVERKAPGN